ncbi:MAG: maleylpyruvate isomerase family mycothiol-dependent enzyme [Nocardioides sp.]
MPEDSSTDLPPVGTEMLAEATGRLVRSVDALPDEGWAGPSLLPGWTRAHTLAHLTLNAEGLAGALRGVVAGDPVPMYASQEARDADIDELAQEPPEVLRTRFLGATTELADALAAVPDDTRDAEFERVPGGRRVQAGHVAGMRLHEVEIHHVDLAAGPTQADWSPAYCTVLLDRFAAAQGPSRPFHAHATDLGRTWPVGDPGPEAPTVSGTGADLGWWLTGRGDGAGLTCDAGSLPEVGTP